jgi:serine/threonine protein kinase
MSSGLLYRQSSDNLKVLQSVKASTKGSVTIASIPSDVSIIGSQCFCGCKSLCEVIFENGSKLQRIEEQAFLDTGVKTIRIPSSVEFLGEYCFCVCESLYEVIFEGNVKVIQNNVFSQCDSLKCVKVPRGVNLNYKFPEECRIEYIDIAEMVVAKPKVFIPRGPPVTVSKPAPVKQMSDLVIELDVKYEEFSSSLNVHFMRHRETGEEIAVKTFDVRDPRNQKDFVSEVEALKKLNHPNIIKLKGCCLPRQSAGAKIIMEYVGGGTLQELLKSNSAKPRWWTSTRKSIVIVELGKGRKFIHSKGFLHRDLKPTNILVDDEHDIKISDFGSSREYDTDVTMTNIGTPLYMAPEVSEGHYDQKIDVYSFGIILYEIVTGNGLFSNDGNKMKLFVDMQTGKRPDIPEYVFGFIRDMIEKCWSQTSSKRPEFKDIWEILKTNEFNVMDGIDAFTVISRISGIEAHEQTLGIKID